MSARLSTVTAKRGARRVALGYLEQAAAACERLGDESDAEALHDLRVAVRRLRSCLRAYEPLLAESASKKKRRRLAKITRRTSPGRDAEVQLAWLAELAGPNAPPAVRRLRERLEARRNEAYAQLRDELAQRFGRLHDELRKSLSSYTVRLDDEGAEDPPFARFTAGVIARELRALTEGLAAIEGVGDLAAMHRARIRGKRVRYLLEPFRDEVEGAHDAVRALKRLQDLLGDLHDLANLAELARGPSAPPDPSEDAAAELADLLARIAAERFERFERFEREWRGAELESFERGVREVALRLEQSAGDASLEIERKYLLRALPPACAGRDAIEIDQGYLPGERLVERVRRTRTESGERYVRTVKLGAGVARIEVEEECSAEVFRTLWSLTEGRRLRKRRYPIAEGELVWEIDEFLDRELWLAEVELPREDANVELPAWLAPYVVRDVTGEPAYVNANLAR